MIFNNYCTAHWYIRPQSDDEQTINKLWPIRITSRPPTRKRKWNQVSQFWRISTKIIPIENLSWSYFNNEPKIQEKQQVKDHQSWIFIFVACLTIPSSNYIVFLQVNIKELQYLGNVCNLLPCIKFKAVMLIITLFVCRCFDFHQHDSKQITTLNNQITTLRATND